MKKLINIFLFCCMNAGGIFDKLAKGSEDISEIEILNVLGDSCVGIGRIFDKLAECPQASGFLVRDFAARHPEFGELPAKIVGLSKEKFHTEDDLSS